MDRDNSREPMLEMFIFETLQLADQLEQLVLSSEKINSFEAAAINEIFRIMHTIKGSAAMMLFNNISLLAHAMEDLFYYLRETEHPAMDYSKLCDFVLDGIDFIKGEIAKIENKLDSDGDPGVMLEDIRGYLATMQVQQDRDVLPEHTVSDSANKDQKYYISSVVMPKTIEKSEENRFTARVFFEEGCEMENVRAFNIVHKLKNLASVLHYSPPDIIENQASIPLIRQSGFQIVFASTASRDELEEFFRKMAFVVSVELELLDGELDNFTMLENSSVTVAVPDREEVMSSADKDVNGALNATKKQNIISVQLNKLDNLLDLVGELVISEAMVTGNPDLTGMMGMENFSKAVRQHRKVINELQDVVMSIRMVPLAGTFQKMNRIVRDMSKKIGKQVEIEIRGEETEVDKNIIEHLSDPLMHLIRNAIDHGIEASEQRIVQGKAASGRIILEGKNEGGDVWITVRDDGAGLNKEMVLNKAREHGLINKTESELSDQEIYAFILLPGFSTKKEITEFSGRGVGMDVVAKNIEDIGGSVYVDSVPGEGTTVSLKIPLTLAIIDGMGIKVGRSIYTVPITSIRESFKAREDEVFADPDGHEMIMVRGECLPILRLHQVHKIQTQVQEIQDGIIMIAETDNRSVCLFADELLGEQQVVVKALPKYLKKIKGIGGCTLLGDGKSSLILDIAGLVNY